MCPRTLKADLSYTFSDAQDIQYLSITIYRDIVILGSIFLNILLLLLHANTHRDMDALWSLKKGVFDRAETGYHVGSIEGRLQWTTARSPKGVKSTFSLPKTWTRHWTVRQSGG